LQPQATCTIGSGYGRIEQRARALNERAYGSGTLRRRLLFKQVAAADFGVALDVLSVVGELQPDADVIREARGARSLTPKTANTMRPTGRPTAGSTLRAPATIAYRTTC